MTMPTPRGDLLIQGSPSLEPGDNWMSGQASSAGVSEVLVAVATDNTEDFSAYLVQSPDVSGVAADMVPLSVETITFPLDFSTYYVAKATIPLNAAVFSVWLFNASTTAVATFGVSVRALSKDY